MVQDPETAQEWLEFISRTRQSHHDIFVRLAHQKASEGEQLTFEEQANYDLAMRREQEGLVEPLS